MKNSIEPTFLEILRKSIEIGNMPEKKEDNYTIGQVAFQGFYDERLWFSALDYLIDVEKYKPINEREEKLGVEAIFNHRKSCIYDRIKEMFKDEKNTEFTNAFLLANGLPVQKDDNVRKHEIDFCLQNRFAEAELEDKKTGRKVGVAHAFSSEGTLEERLKNDPLKADNLGDSERVEVGHYAVCSRDSISVFSFTADKMIIRAIDCLENLQGKIEIDRNEIYDVYNKLVEGLKKENYPEFFEKYNELANDYLNASKEVSDKFDSEINIKEFQ